ncbi:diguanylate cyclase [uncultured Marinobacter sp.]|uniref:GGDEF domain-containing protein n=1 Tax=uncultured Marinobacter sp. TaxID=187379 RepID=UPI0030DD6C52
MSLQSRFILYTSLLILSATLITFFAFDRVSTRIVEEWGQRIAGIQVRYDSARLAQPLEREIALAYQFADSTVLKRWIAQRSDDELKAQAMEEMESYRRSFHDNNYFVALLEDGAYFHNNAGNDYGDDPLRYYLNPQRPDDAWFYLLVEEGRDFHLNVNPDSELGVTKLWIDVLIRDGDDILGIVGTGLNLERFLEEVVDIGQPGITSLFVDVSGAIQLYRDVNLIDYASLVKPEGQKNTIDVLLNNEADRSKVKAMMATLQANPEDAVSGQTVLTDFVTVDDRRHLLGISLMPAIGWYEITLIDLAVLMPVSSFLPIVVVFTVLLIISLVLLYLALRRWLLNPIADLEQAMQQLRDGHFEKVPLPEGKGEMASLIQIFSGMSDAIRKNTRELESRVRQRTSELEELARKDPLTNLLNRRGVTEVIEAERERVRRQGKTLGVLWIDLDNFKALNDADGHAVGDEALQAVSAILSSNLRGYDHAARWGGDEFLVVLSPCDAEALAQLGERLRQSIAEAMQARHWSVTASIGGYLVQPKDSLDNLLRQADGAMYQAKAKGRDRLNLV